MIAGCPTIYGGHGRTLAVQWQNMNHPTFPLECKFPVLRVSNHKWWGTHMGKQSKNHHSKCKSGRHFSFGVWGLPARRITGRAPAFGCFTLFSCTAASPPITPAGRPLHSIGPDRFGPCLLPFSVKGTSKNGHIFACVTFKRSLGVLLVSLEIQT